MQLPMAVECVVVDVDMDVDVGDDGVRCIGWRCVVEGGGWWFGLGVFWFR